MSYTITSTVSFLADLLLPPRKTERAIRALTPALLQELALPDGTLPYHDPCITALVWELKYRKNPHALRVAAQFLREQVVGCTEESLGRAVLIPVPMHESRRKERGYNQTELLCEAIMVEINGALEYVPNALTRTRNTRPQQGLARHRRLLNIKGAMQVIDSELVAQKTCILIDDVRTTGATTEEARRALLAAGAKEVHSITLAHS